MSKAKKTSKPVKTKTIKSGLKPAKASRKGPAKRKPANSLDELIKTFDKLISVIMFDSPLEVFDAITSKDLMAYGTTLYERTLDRSSFKAAIVTQREQSKGLDVAIRRIPVFAKVSESGMSGIVVEELEITITGVGASPFASLARVSASFSLKGSQWEALLIHASRPEHDSEGKDSWHVAEWSTRVTELEQQVGERTAELLVKNRELEVETALERVRASAMAMHHSEELAKVGEVIFAQLVALGLRLETITFTTNFTGSDFDVWMVAGGVAFPKQVIIPYFDHPYFDRAKEVYEKGEDSWSTVFDKPTKDRFFKHVYEHAAELYPQGRIEFALSTPGYSVSNVQVENLWLGMARYNTEPFADEENALFWRFKNVFTQAYTRFLDLKKAEAQAAAVRIENALEKVRSRSLAMHKSEEMTEVVSEVMTRLKDLDVDVESTNILVYNEGSPDFEVWSAGTQAYSLKFHVPISSTPHLQLVVRAIGRQESLVASSYSFEEKNSWFNFLFENTEFSQIASDRKRYIMESPLMGISVGLSKNVGIQINSYHQPAFSARENEIIIRFARVFEQAYTRFLDLQKAEDQAREAEIELALERIRARTMAMHRSEELPEVTAVLFQQMKGFGFDAFMSSIVLYDHTTTGYEMLMSSDVQSVLPKAYKVPYFDNSFYRKFISSFDEGVPYKEFEFGGEEKRDYDRKFFTETDFRDLPETSKQMMIGLERCTICCAYMKFGCIEAIGERPLQPGHALTLQRFTKVFEQTYTRFLDLQKAEAQARESQIEAAMERVRSRAMAMHKSEELSEVASVLFHQLQGLGINGLRRSAVNIMNESESDWECWYTSLHGDSFAHLMKMPVLGNPAVGALTSSWQKQEIYEVELVGAALKDFMQFLLNHGWKYAPGDSSPQKFIMTGIPFSRGTVLSFTSEVLEAAEIEIMKRFAKVFEQTYTRFLDLQKAEAQAREAQIEAALERVRSSAMAMRSSDELTGLIGKVFSECTKLGIPLDRGIIVIFDPDTGDSRWWMASPEANELPKSYLVKYHDHIPYQAYVKAWKERRVKWTYLLEGEVKKNWDAHVFVETELSLLPEVVKAGMRGFQGINLNTSFNNFGGITLSSPVPISEEDFDVILRFAKVFDLTYTRFNDLRQAEFQTRNAESNAREASRQASLDRVRAEIASMRTTTDLERITPLIWRELNTLGVPFVRCGVFIMDEQHQRIQTFLSTPDGKAIAAFNLPYDSIGNLQGAVSSWRAHQTFITHWLDKDFQAQADVLVKEGAVTSREQYLSTIPREGIHLHFLPFLQGMIYVGSMEPLTTDHMHVIQSVADAFSTAYARYEDFNQLERTKKQVENTLADLKQTQVQLVQSEKMASLGELTAGIAHEIQNPLNFVNNFAEVSKELLDEMKAELDAGNMKPAADLAMDVIQNLEKINFHGRRADGIVKSMLQHSRKSSGQKELTDLNELCDEYLRLSYHGLRAKDKSFNAKFESDLDKNLPRVSIVSQDIGRVVLNLINNAFYAVSEKKKLNHNGYEPTVTVSTRSVGKNVEIRIKDNGVGIPEKVKDKIFQPFFTTKPAGQGTGLGLSLAYDIIKSHGGNMRVDTKENEYTAFFIELPQ